jgi:hypothetical protein
MTTDDPWSQLTPPAASSSLSARRIDSTLPWNFFWAIDVERSFLLVLRFSQDSYDAKRTLPKPKGIQITSEPIPGTSERFLLFRLLDAAQRALFYQLCLDIIESTREAETEKVAVASAINRTWRWHHLLKGGGSSLSEDEQKGLFGELCFLEQHLLPNLPPEDAVASWTGPFGAPKDFEIGDICVEAKTRRGAATPYVMINSEHQLDDASIRALFLFVTDVARDITQAGQGETLSVVINRIRRLISWEQPEALAHFESALAAIGYRRESGQEEFSWIVAGSTLYLVAPDFPKIRATDLAPGLSNVRYSLSLVECERFQVETEALLTHIGGDPEK